MQTILIGKGLKSRRVLALGALFPALLGAVLLVRTARFSSHQVDADPADHTVVDSARVAAHLSEALRYRTVSYQDAATADSAEFAGFRSFLARVYPLVYSRLKREMVGDSLLFTWEGRDPSRKPILLMAHMDVVPVEPGTESRWKYPPFEGRIADGQVWGRGAIDDKLALIALMDTIEGLLEAGFSPRRSVYLEIGNDEEVGGVRGAARVAGLLESRGLRFEYVLDEGGLVLRGGVPGVASPVAVIGVAEKGYLTLELSAESEGGHSSTPPRHTAAGLVSAAVFRLEEHPMPASIRGAARETFEKLGPEMPFWPRFAMANLWLVEPIVRSVLERDARTNAMIRTTTAATMLQGSAKENVLPARASAVVNFRILPGDTVDSVTEHVRRTIADSRVNLRRLMGWNPSRVSNLDSASGLLMQKTVRQVFGGALVAPTLMLGASDSRRFAGISDDVYGFIPLDATADVLRFVHGSGERVRTADCGNAVRFYTRLLRNTAE